MMTRKRNRSIVSSQLQSPFNDIDQMWQKESSLVRRFLEQRPDYEHLCTEVVYILEKRFKELGIGFSAIPWRAKTLNSFLEKIQRKGYSDPFMNIQDFAGIRIVYLYKQDFSKIEDVIYKEFEVLEKADKLEEKGSDHFGYLATHFIARLGSASSGARYEDLKHLIFELQVRTVLQDAWAIIDHHLAYKHESDVPKHLQRKLTRIAGMFEMVDEDFDEIRSSINVYVIDLNKLSQNDTKQFLGQSLDLNSFQAYLKWKFSNLPLSIFVEDEELEHIFNKIDKKRYTTLLELDKMISLTDNSRENISEIFASNGYMTNDAISQFSLSLGTVDKDYRSRITPKVREFFEDYIDKKET